MVGHMGADYLMHVLSASAVTYWRHVGEKTCNSSLIRVAQVCIYVWYCNSLFNGRLFKGMYVYTSCCTIFVRR